MTAKVVRALMSAHISETIQLREGELWAADDDIVLAHPEWFSTDLLAVARRTSAPKTAAPAAKRGRKYRTADEKVDDL